MAVFNPFSHIGPAAVGITNNFCIVLAIISSYNLSKMSGAPSVQQQQQYLQQVRAQVQQQMMQEVMTKMSEKCFKVNAIRYFIVNMFTLVISFTCIYSLILSWLIIFFHFTALYRQKGRPSRQL